MKTPLVMSLLVFCAACAPRSVVSDGTYASDSTAALPDATMVIDVAAKTAAVTLSGANTPIALELVAVAEADWERGCPTNVSSVAVETWRVTPDPTVLGSLSLSGAKLLAGCGLDAADPDTVELAGTGEPNATQYRISFTRR